MHLDEGPVFVGFSPLRSGSKNVESTNFNKRKRLSVTPMSTKPNDRLAKVAKFKFEDSVEHIEVNSNVPAVATFDVILIDSEGTSLVIKQ